MNNMNPKVAWTIFIIFCVIALGAVGYFSYKYYQDASKPVATTIVVNPATTTTPSATTATTSTSTPAATTTPTADKTADWKTYSDTVFSWHFKYPTNYTIQEDGALGTSQKIVNSVALYKNNNLVFTINDYDKVISDTQFKTPFSGTMVPASYDTKISEQLTTLNGINVIEEITEITMATTKQAKVYYLRDANNKLVSIGITNDYINDSEVAEILNTFQL